MVGCKLVEIWPPAKASPNPTSRPPANVPPIDTKPPSTAAINPLRMRPSALPNSKTVELVLRIMAAPATKIPMAQAMSETDPALIPSMRAVGPSSAMALIRTPHLDRKNSPNPTTMANPTTIVTT